MNRLLAFLLSITLVGPALADSMGSSSGGQAGNQSNQAGCRYNTSPPSLQNGQQVGLQCDVNGNLLTSGGGTGGGNVNLTGINGTAPSSTNGLPVTTTTATSTVASGTVAAGGTFQQVFASSTTRKGCFVQNPVTATEPLSVEVQASGAVYTLTPGGWFSCNDGLIVRSDAILVSAATTGHAFSADSQ